MKLQIQRPVAFVPTMGALHAGHQSLVKIAKSYVDKVVVSIFINPLQFENADDFSNYPKTFLDDSKLAEESGATFVWAPTLDEIYPTEPEIISAGEIGNLFEGVHRFGHFDGVLTVVKRLFDLVEPTHAIFGEKDFQQLFLIKDMVAKLELPIEIIAAPTIRESSGLAMSSRNSQLESLELERASGIYKALVLAGNKPDIEQSRELLTAELLAIPDFLLDYAEIIDEQNFRVADSRTVNARAVVAGWINGVRLIDNMAMSYPRNSK